MEEESNGSSERSSTSSEESAPYFPHQSTDNSSHGINSQEEEEESSDDHRSKRRKHAPVLEEDRISTLPDSILLKILSSLCIIGAVVTGVLSKRWAYLWTSVPSLRFTHTYFKSSVDYANAVDNVLLLHRALKLTNFSVQFQYMPDLKPRINLWVRFATTAKVDQLSLRLSSWFYKLPQHLYANEFVSELDFRLCKIKPNGLVRWSSLKRLCIGYVPLREDVVNKVLLGSPRLEFLKLHNCYQFNRLDIVSESLKKLVIDCYPTGPDLDDLELEIVAPKIESLEIIGDFFSMAKFQIKNASALVEVRVDFEIPMEYDDEEQKEYHYKDCENVVRELFECLHQVKKLTVGKWCLMFLVRSYDEVIHWKSKEVYFKSLLQCLKTVMIFGFRKCFQTKKVFILVVKFLLMNAKILEKMIITEPRVMQNETRNMLLKAVVIFPLQESLFKLLSARK